MRRLSIIIAALAIVAGAAFAPVSAKKKDKKDAKAAPAQVELRDGSDSLSYAGGISMTEGLIPHLQQQMNVDTAYMADFIQGLRDAKEKANDPRFVAYQAGGQIAGMILNRFVPGLSGDLKGTRDSVVVDKLYAGFIAALEADTAKFTSATAQKYFNERMQQNATMKEEAAKEAGRLWLEENAKKEGVQTTASGLQYKVITMGVGDKPTATDEVEVKYEGQLIDGTVFDSSYKRNPQTTKFKANQVIKGWTEGLQLMPVGSKFEFYIPQELGYGGRATGQIPAFSTLIFTVELVGITK